MPYASLIFHTRFSKSKCNKQKLIGRREKVTYVFHQDKPAI